MSELDSSPYNPNFQSFRHFLSTEGMRVEEIKKIFKLAESFFDQKKRMLKKVPILRGFSIATLFFEPSTRTRTTFELAAKRLSADVLNIDIGYSSSKKGETLLDAVRNLEAMQVNMLVVRHFQSGAAYFLAKQIGPNVSIINAGDGCHQHPTQALLDAFTIQQHKSNFSDLTIVILGDIEHSRVARSQMHVFLTLGVKQIRLISPKTLLNSNIFNERIKHFSCIEKGLDNADVIIVLRLQKERMTSTYLPSFKEYFEHFGLTKTRLNYAKSDAIVMHPGPVNRSVEIVSEIVDGKRSVILEQVENGIAIRMAVMTKLSESFAKENLHAT